MIKGSLSGKLIAQQSLQEFSQENINQTQQTNQMLKQSKLTDTVQQTGVTDPLSLVSLNKPKFQSSFGKQNRTEDILKYNTNFKEQLEKIDIEKQLQNIRNYRDNANSIQRYYNESHESNEFGQMEEGAYKNQIYQNDVKQIQSQNQNTCNPSYLMYQK
ncbi:hypothetical protein PPERSA_01617 [Pseudocohnilembus persalinus]|uniref:Uncharacterized protein n=1 Tax=Pseudocohnilembus persalinus TaxID=266149 RepID=A0A0V0QHJ7_PSEPJ|nr:hypothetical protein PPERSA_01617 [Pseudocohnilembus persalinus]|eukprot:KRX01747.1 hypothetical protein PPERSA_01617 [Pseudocohnilembus persalinus]